MEKVINKLVEIAKSKGWDEISIIGKFNNNPVYWLRRSYIPQGAKLGYPILYTTNKKGVVYKIESLDIIREIIKYASFENRNIIQKISI